MQSSIAYRSKPLPDSAPMHAQENGGEASINLGNIIQDLLKNEDYLDTLTEPSPYENIPTTTMSSSEVIPDLLQFSKPILDLSVPVITLGEFRQLNVLSKNSNLYRVSQNCINNLQLIQSSSQVIIHKLQQLLQTQPQ